MKCPYNNFTDCIVEQCPSCIYETINTTEIEGRYPMYLSSHEAVKQGYAWEVNRKSYKFISCKLMDNNVQPVLSKNETVNVTNVNSTSVSIRKSMF